MQALVVSPLKTHIESANLPIGTGLKVNLPPLWHWRAFVRHYAVKEMLGKGQYGCVHLASRFAKTPVLEPRVNTVTSKELSVMLHRDDDLDTSIELNGTKEVYLNTVAVKSVMKKSRKANSKFLREICIHAHVTSVQEQQYGIPAEWVVPLHAVIFGWKNRLAAVMPVCRGGTLENEMDWARRSMSKIERVRYTTRRWAEGDRILQWLHEHCLVIHGDAHGGNWYIDTENNGKLLLADFGESRLLHEIADTRQFLLLASQERTLFRFETAVESDDKRRLGEKLLLLDTRLERETGHNGKSLAYRSMGSSTDASPSA